MINSRQLILMALATILLSGCHLRPNFGPPGTIGMQRSRAVLHDPFPSDELGPVIVGARPKGFERPQSEATNLQDVRGSLFTTNSAFQTVPGPAAQPTFTPPPQAYPQYQSGF